MKSDEELKRKMTNKKYGLYNNMEDVSKQN